MITQIERQQLEERLESVVFRPLTHTSRAWFLWFTLLVVMAGGGFAAYLYQLQNGLVVTGMRDTVTWGVYISNFVFFSGVSMAGTFISSILRLTGAEWRRPITRLAELTTVAALLMCGLMPIVDMGRPDRLLNILYYGRLESPLVWDIVAIPTYLTASAIYLYLFLIPDSAVLRDKLKVSALRHRLYSVLALRWQALPEQRKNLALAAGVMMLLVVPIGVTVHSVVSWIFGMTFRAGWDSTIFAPYFAIGALYSGVAMIITLMLIARRVYHLEEYFTEKHFTYLSYMLGAFGLIYLYFTFAEYLTIAYKLEGGERLLLQELFFGRYAFLVWPGFIGGQILPILMLAFKRTRTLPLLFIGSIFVNVGMWIKRYIIVVPSLANPLMPYEWGVYTPTAIELIITVASFAGFALVISLFAKFFPIISVWEMREGWEHASEPAPAQMRVMGTAELAPALLPVMGTADGTASE